MQPAKPGHPFGTRPEHQVIGVAQDDIGAQVTDLIHVHCLDCPAGSDRHEGRSPDRTARHRDFATPRLAVGGEKLELESVSGHGLLRNNRLESP
jgi:hypothetical protein